jgi:hypothetical protein
MQKAPEVPFADVTIVMPREVRAQYATLSGRQPCNHLLGRLGPIDPRRWLQIFAAYAELQPGKVAGVPGFLDGDEDPVHVIANYGRKARDGNLGFRGCSV